MVASPAIWTGISLLFKDIRVGDLEHFGILLVCQFQSGATGAAAFYPLHPPSKAASKYDYYPEDINFGDINVRDIEFIFLFL